MTTSAPYYGDSSVMRTPPPDLPSLLLKERIVYLGLPLFSDDNTKRQVGLDVTELIIVSRFTRNSIIQTNRFISISTPPTAGTPAMPSALRLRFAICDTLRYIKPPIHTICIGQPGTAAVILSAEPRSAGSTASRLHRVAPTGSGAWPGHRHPDPRQGSPSQQAGHVGNPSQHRTER